MFGESTTKKIVLVKETEGMCLAFDSVPINCRKPTPLQNLHQLPVVQPSMRLTEERVFKKRNRRLYKLRACSGQPAQPV